MLLSCSFHCYRLINTIFHCRSVPGLVPRNAAENTSVAIVAVTVIEGEAGAKARTAMTILTGVKARTRTERENHLVGIVNDAAGVAEVAVENATVIAGAVEIEIVIETAIDEEIETDGIEIVAVRDPQVDVGILVTVIGATNATQIDDASAKLNRNVRKRKTKLLVR